MRAELRRNLERLLAPRQVAVIGGRDAAAVIQECKRMGYDGLIWPVNPKRGEMAGYPCYARIGDLPGPPDAAFMAIPRDAAVAAVSELSALGAGGVVCYTAGFAETGSAGRSAEADLVTAAGDMAVLGPNCYGLLNYLDRAALWPFPHGGGCPGYGAAIITQSGMLGSDITMNQRNLPLAFVISAGNQAVLGLEDLVEILAERDQVRAIGLHIEGLKDVAGFIRAACAALEKNIPIVALKTGKSVVGSRLTLSHTGSLAGTDQLYQALFDKLGIIRVHAPSQLLETLKFVSVSGIPKGRRLAGFTCSGGGATLLADHADEVGLVFPAPTEATRKILRQRLPDIATVSNPLDYTTPIWGDAERLAPVMNGMLSDPYDAAVLVQDYPLPGLDHSKSLYLNDAEAFIAACAAARIPGAVCSTLPENIDRETRDLLIARGVAPMQGIGETLSAISAAAGFGIHRRRMLEAGRPGRLRSRPAPGAGYYIDEWRGKQRVRAAGIPVPEGRLVSMDEAPMRAMELGFPVALKLVHPGLAHKTEIGAVAVDLTDRQEVAAAAQQIRFNVAGHHPEITVDRFLVEKMAPAPVAELLVGLRNDPQFGLALTLASGGILTELVDDAATLLLPAGRQELGDALARLRMSRLLDGYRTSPKADRDVVIDSLQQLCDYARANAESILELEVNPLLILADSVCAVDVLMRIADDGSGARSSIPAS